MPGITGPTVDIERYSLSDRRRVLDVNLTSTFLCCKAAITPMRRQNGGRIVNLASIAGKEGNASMAGDAAAKAGVIALTKSLSKELAATEIRVNAIAPAMIATDLVRKSLRWSPGSPPMNAHFRPERCFISPVGGQRIDQPTPSSSL